MAQAAGAAVGTLIAIGAVVGSAMLAYRKVANGNGRSRQSPRNCPILDNQEVKDLSRAKLERLKEQTMLLRDIHNELKDQRTAHALMLERLERQ